MKKLLLVPLALCLLGVSPYFAGNSVYIEKFKAIYFGDKTKPNMQVLGGDATLSSGSVTVTFTTAFGAAPSCTCSNIQATPIVCGPSATASTSAVTFVVPSGASTHIGWQCIGQGAN